MADKLQFQAPTIYTQRASEINFDDGTAQFMSDLSGAFLSIAQEAHQSQLQSEIAQAQQDGALAGSMEGARFKPSERKGIVHKTYNDSGIQSATVQMSIKSQEAVQRIALQNPGNPEIQKHLLDKWSDSFAQDLDPQLLVPFRETFGVLSASQITSAQKERAKVLQSEAISNFNDLELSLQNSLEVVAPKMFAAGTVGEDAARTVETLRKNYIEMLAQNGPSSEYSVGGYKIPAGSGRSGAFTVEEIGAKIREFDKQALSASIKGSFITELEAGRGVGTYFNFVKGNTVLSTVSSDGSIQQTRVDDLLSNEDKEKLGTFMRTHISTLNSFEDANDKRADKARKQYNQTIMDRALKIGFSESRLSDGQIVLQGNPEMLRMLYLQAVNDDSGLVELKTIEGIQSLMETVGTGDIADPQVVSNTKLSVINGDTTRIQDLPEFGLGDQARGELVEMIQKKSSGNHWSNSKRYTTMIDLGKAALAPEAATGFNLFSDPKSQSAQDFAEFKERLMNDILGAEMAGTLPLDINALPGKDEFDIQARARELISEIKQKRTTQEQDPELMKINERINKLTDILNNPDTIAAEAKRARDQLKEANKEKSRIQSRTF